MRRARPQDKASILPFASTTFGGHDYIPEVFDDWLVATDGVVLVAEVGAPPGGGVARDAYGEALDSGQVIAMTRVARLSEEEAWLEGIRVDPRVRGMEVASDLQVAELHWIEALGVRVVRYLTGEANVGSQHLGARHGLLEIGRWRSWAVEGERVVGHEHFETLDRASEADWERVAGDPTFAAAHGLYEWRPWSFQELTRERFLRHVARGEALALTNGEGRAIVFVNREPWLGDEGQVHVAFAAGHGGAVLDLLASLGRPEVRLADPDPPLLHGFEKRFADAGYRPWPTASIIVERRIDAAHPIPDVDPSRLILLEAPANLVEAPGLG